MKALFYYRKVYLLDSDPYPNNNNIILWIISPCWAFHSECCMVLGLRGNLGQYYRSSFFSLRSDSIEGQPWVLFLVDPLCPKFIDNHLSRSCHSPVLFFNAEHDSVPSFSCPDVLTSPSWESCQWETWSHWILRKLEIVNQFSGWNWKKSLIYLFPDILESSSLE